METRNEHWVKPYPAPTQRHEPHPCWQGLRGWNEVWKWDEVPFLCGPVRGDARPPSGPQKSGQNQKWLRHPCLLRGPHVGGSAM